MTALRLAEAARPVATAPGDLSVPRPDSQCGRLLAILKDGRWHSSRSLHAAVFCILHSRVAELRQRGFVIEHRGGGAGTDHHEYRLLLKEVSVPPEGRADASLSGSHASSPLADGYGTAAAQLTVDPSCTCGGRDACLFCALAFLEGPQ